MIRNQTKCGSEYPQLVIPLVRNGKFENIYLPRKLMDHIEMPGLGLTRLGVGVEAGLGWAGAEGTEGSLSVPGTSLDQKAGLCPQVTGPKLPCSRVPTQSGGT